LSETRNGRCERINGKKHFAGGWLDTPNPAIILLHKSSRIHFDKGINGVKAEKSSMQELVQLLLLSER
jgi:hypothetical protein